MVSQLGEYEVGQWFYSLPQKLQTTHSLSLEEKDIDFIIRLLPKNMSYTEYNKILKLGPGIHSPCIYDLFPALLMQKNIKKTSDGKKGIFYSTNNEEAKDIVKKINSEYKKFGYGATRRNNKIILSTSPYTSISYLLSKIGLTPLYWKHDESNETVVFAEPFNCKSYDLDKVFTKIQKEFQDKWKCKIEFPHNVSKICGRIILPNTQCYSQCFMEFLIEEKPRKPLLLTHLVLYNMAEKGLPLHLIKKRDLIKIINKYVGTSIRTLEKQFEDKKTRTVQELLQKIFDLAEPKTVLNLQVQNDPLPHVFKKHSFDIESKKLNQTLSFTVKNSQITCDICDSKTCNHIPVIYEDQKILNAIARRGITLDGGFYRDFFSKLENLSQGKGDKI